MVTNATVLIVEDDVASLNSISELLRLNNIKVRGVPFGELALQAIEKGFTDLILLDINLPDISGFEVCERLKSDERFSDIPIIFLTAHDDPHIKVKAFEEGGVDYITKPFEEKETIARVKTHIELYRIKKNLDDIVDSRTYELKEQEERFRQLAEHINEVFWLLDWKTKDVLYLSPGYERIWNRPATKVYETIDEFTKSIIPEDREKAIQTLSRADQGPYSIEYRICRPDNSIRDIHDRGYPVKDKNGEIVRIAGIAEDITDRKLAEEELRKTQMHYTDFINASTDEVAYWKVPDKLHVELPVSKQIDMIYNSICIDGNKTVAKSLGLETLDNLIGKRYIDLIKTKTLDEAFRQFIKNNYTLQNYEIYEKHASGDEYYGLENWHGLIKDGYLTHLWTSSTDITELRLAQLALSKSEETLKKIIENTSGKSGDEYFCEIVKTLEENTGASYSFIGDVTSDRQIRTIAISQAGKLLDNIIYNLEGTPCEKTISGSSSIHFNNILELYPNYNILSDPSINGYLATPLISKTKRVIGILVSIFSEPIVDPEFSQSLFELFADRIAGEMQRIEGERSLTKSEIRFRSIFNNSMDAVGVLKDETFVNANEAFVKLFGYSSDQEILSIHPVELVAPEERHRIKDFSELKKQDDEFITIGLRKNRTKFIMDVRVSSYTIFDEIYTQVILRDITDTKRYQEELELNNIRLESMLAISQNIFDNLDQLRKYAVKQIVKLTRSEQGYLYDYLKNDDQLRLICLADRKSPDTAKTKIPESIDLNTSAFWQETITVGKPANYTLPVEGSKIQDTLGFLDDDISKCLILPFQYDKAVKAVIVLAGLENKYTSQDIKQITLIMDAVWKVQVNQQYQVELIKAKEKAEESDHLKSAFLASMSHEIRTPLNAILGFSNLIADSSDDPELDEFVRIINTQNELLLKIINDIIDFAKVEAGVMDLQKKPFNLNEIINELKQIMLPECPDGVELITQCSSSKIMINADQYRVKQVYADLLSNAVKFTRSGKICFGYKTDENNQLQCFVTDTGIGIAKENHHRVFERFTKLDQFSKGTGLGLSIVSKIVDILGGSIQLDSEQGVGSSFTFSFTYSVDSDSVIQIIDQQESDK